MSVVTLVTAPGGTGKSLTRGPVELLENFLQFGEGVFHTTIPINVDAVAAEAKRRFKIDEDETRARINVIPLEVESGWLKDIRDGGTNPQEYFHDAEPGRIVLDESHLLCPPTASREHREMWQSFVGEVRHDGYDIEFLTQTISSLPPEIVKRCGHHIVLHSYENEPDPILRIRLGAYFQIASKIYGKKVFRIGIREYDQRGERLEELKQARRTVWAGPYYYRLYDSYAVGKRVAAREGEGGSREERRVKEPFERMGWFRLLYYIVRTHAWQIGRAAGVAMFVTWLLFGADVEGALFSSGTRDAKDTAATAEPARTGTDVAAAPGGPSAETAGRPTLAPAREPVTLLATVGTVAIFDDGNRYEVGDHVGEGEYRRRIDVIDPRGVVVLDSDERLHVGRRSDTASVPAAAADDRSRTAGLDESAAARF